MSRLAASLLALLATPLFAQSPAPRNPAPQNPAPTALPIFRASLPGGTYEVATRAIVAVTSHEYLVDGIARVTEVNIDTNGSLLARFYYLEPNAPNSPLGIGSAAIEKAQQLLTEGAEKSGQDAWKKVVKNYPTTTHARTVEYRVSSKEELTKLFNAAEEAFRLQRPGSVSVQ